MKIKFTKMTGAGNDFVLINNRLRKVKLTAESIARICDRNFGVGADGVLLVEPGGKEADFKMVYFNADGSPADMCGNGARCFAKFVRPLLKKAPVEKLSFMTGAGRIEAKFHGDDVAINMTAPHSLQTYLTLPTSSGNWVVHSVNTGVPHVVCFVNQLDTLDVLRIGAEMRYHAQFSPAGANVNFVQKTGADTITVRTYERGVEGETLACGTGVVASSILAHEVEGISRPVKVRVRSGALLTVNFQRKNEAFTNVILQGPATGIFTGEMRLA